MIIPKIFLWCRLIILTVIKNRLLFLVSAVLSNRHKNIHFLCRLLKIADTKNKSLFLVTTVLNNRNQSPDATRGQKIETDGRAGEVEKYLSERVLSLLILPLGPLSFLSSHSVLSLLSFLWFWRDDNLRGRRRHGGRWAWRGGGGRRWHGEAEAVGGGMARRRR
jgi:hypothetical protein